MYSKLTLNLNQDIISRAKVFAKSNRVSLSKIVEKYLDSLSYFKPDQNSANSPITRELSGLLKKHKSLDIKKYRHERLKAKYL